MGKTAKAVARKKSAAKRATVKRAPTSSATRPALRPRDVAAELLKKRGGGEIGVRELAELTVADRRVKLRGKTPAATVASQIYVAAAKGELFEKTSRGMVRLVAAA